MSLVLATGKRDRARSAARSALNKGCSVEAVLPLHQKHKDGMLCSIPRFLVNRDLRDGQISLVVYAGGVSAPRCDRPSYRQRVEPDSGGNLTSFH
jgi:hypothetical protein